MLAGCATSPATRPHVSARERPPAATDGSASGDSAPTDGPASGDPAPTGLLPSPAIEVPGAPTADRAAPRGWFLPVTNRSVEAVISRFGDARDGGRRSHEGIDIAAPRGTQVVAPVGGRIVVSGTRSRGGNVVVLIDSTGEYEFVFSHLHARRVARGERVAAGDVLGTVGTTGNAAGGPPHLHFEVWLGSAPIDPYPLLAAAAPRTAGR